MLIKSSQCFINLNPLNLVEIKNKNNNKVVLGLLRATLKIFLASQWSFFFLERRKYKGYF